MTIIMGPRGTARGGYGLVRVFALFITTYTGRIIGSLLIAIAGIVWGLQSHSVSYAHAPQGLYNITLVPEESRYYIRCVDCPSPHFYLVNTGDFKQFVNFEHSAYLDEMTYRSDSCKDITFEGNKGCGYSMTYLVLRDNSGKLTSYETQEHQDHPDDYYDNRWLLGGPIMLVGVALLIVSLWMLIADKRKYRVTAAA
ncbi:hypothetical protein [Ktedonospora formicarum]|uniref:Uncharacterized protein n=1 Tax=Ktedonospora formicarum TaxID=2778364 RepID=A0A8J3MYM7_9CHLR|nr:hypothetical protein [Ktedonospora formicarum]GHO50983.1 hypothetical protein KSX_91460 [Ktedonospora formicarum]